MTPEETDRLYHEAELVLRVEPAPGEQREIRLLPGVASAELDRWIGERRAGSAVFLPAAKRGARPAKVARRLVKLRSALAEHATVPGVLTLEDGGEPTPGLFAAGMQRARAREVARKLGLERFYWARAGEALEVERATGLAGGDLFEGDGSVLESARDGLQDLARSLRALALSPRPLAALTGGGLRGVAVVALVLVALGAASYGWADRAPAPPPEAGARWEEWKGDFQWTTIRLSLGPAFLVAVLLGLRLRALRGPAIAPAGDRPRERTRAETRSAWAAAAPDVAAVWVLAAAGVALLELSRSAARGLDAVELVGDAGKGLVVCLWLLPAVALSTNVGEAWERGFSALFGALFAILGLRLTLAFAGMGTKILWTILGSVLPFALPELVVRVGNAVADLAAQVVFLALMLGFTWARERERHGLLASGEPLPD